MYELSINDHFSAAHNLRNYKGNCEQLHGHNYKVQAIIKTDELNSIGLAIDFKEFSKLLKEVLSLLDHQYLNDLEYFKEQNPSTENIARFIYYGFKDKLKGHDKVQLTKIICWEEPYSSAAYYE